MKSLQWFGYLAQKCVEYTSRKKKERMKSKSDLLDNIEKVKKDISDFDENGDTRHYSH